MNAGSVVTLSLPMQTKSPNSLFKFQETNATMLDVSLCPRRSSGLATEGLVLAPCCCSDISFHLSMLCLKYVLRTRFLSLLRSYLLFPVIRQLPVRLWRK